MTLTFFWFYKIVRLRIPIRILFSPDGRTIYVITDISRKKIIQNVLHQNDNMASPARDVKKEIRWRNRAWIWRYQLSISFIENGNVVPWCGDSRTRAASAAAWFYMLKRFLSVNQISFIQMMNPFTYGNLTPPWAHTDISAYLGFSRNMMRGEKK